ncbi:collagen alpha-1(I) chain-like [Acinonyx jubatus]|uniref:Collagen alpha-1(I) chain-like n=1 Tax=Acinonyx jubatus TaxID=32536 RepID=A0ABM3PAD3_ACIJB|nr:collagen alpha-1(I) chain-like [Acinonyx jubatus]
MTSAGRPAQPPAGSGSLGTRGAQHFQAAGRCSRSPAAPPAEIPSPLERSDPAGPGRNDAGDVPGARPGPQLLFQPTIHSPPSSVPRGGGLGKRGLHCFASCLAAAPLRGARCRPGSERVKAAGRDKGFGGGARLPRCLPRSLARSVGRSVGLGGRGGRGLAPRSPLSRRLQPPPRSPGPPGLPSALNPPKPRATLPCLRALPSWHKGPELPSPPLLVGPHSRAPSSAARPGTGAGSPGRRFQGTVGEEEPAGPAARPPSRPEPAPPPHPARAAPERPPPPPRAHRPPEPARQAAEAETRHPAAPARSGLERSAAQRSAAPRGRASRAERELPAGGSRDKRPAFLAAPGRASRTGHAGTGRCSGSLLPASERPGAPVCAGRRRPLGMPRAGTVPACIEQVPSKACTGLRALAVSERVLPRAVLCGGRIRVLLVTSSQGGSAGADIGRCSMVPDGLGRSRHCPHVQGGTRRM